MTKNLYLVLGLSRDASKEDIKASFKKLAVQLHPDKNPGNTVAEDRFKEVAEAYATLGDDEKKRAYDKIGSFSSKFRSFQDLMKDGSVDVFNYSPRKKAPKGADIELDLVLTLEEVFSGIEIPLTMKRNISCPLCDSTGAKTTKTCETCSGTGIGMSADFKRESCKICYGAKIVPEVMCIKCKGNGCFEAIQTLKVAIPSGVFSGQAIILQFKGHAGVRGGECGDLVIHILVSPHEKFTREGLDLFINVDVNVTDLVLGGSIRIQTLQNEVEIKIPPGTSSGKQFRIRGYGLKKDDVVGNLFATLNVIIHGTLNDEQRFHYEALRKINDSIEI